MLDESRFASVRDLAEAERVSLSYTSRILRLTLLAPDIVERAIDGGPTAGLARLLETFPVEWEKQREQCYIASILLRRRENRMNDPDSGDASLTPALCLH